MLEQQKNFHPIEGFLDEFNENMLHYMQENPLKANLAVIAELRARIVNTAITEQGLLDYEATRTEEECSALQELRALAIADGKGK